MTNKLTDYVSKKRGGGVPDKEIRRNLARKGWSAADITAALRDDDVPSPNDAPSPMVQSYSTTGFEYLIMFLAMGASAVALGVILHTLVDGLFGAGPDDGFGVQVAVSALVVALPIFMILFRRLHKKEREDPSLRQDSSRTRAIQLTLVVTFIWGMIKIITYVYGLLPFESDSALDFYDGYESYGLDADEPSPLVDFFHLIVTTGIAGSIFAYYWRDSHRSGR